MFFSFLISGSILFFTATSLLFFSSWALATIPKLPLPRISVNVYYLGTSNLLSKTMQEL